MEEYMGLLNFLKNFEIIDDDEEEWDSETVEAGEDYQDDDAPQGSSHGFEAYAVDDELDDESNPFGFSDLDDARIEKVDITRLDPNDVEGYTKGQCEIMEEASYEIKRANDEYDAVKAYFSDIQMIDMAPEDIKTELLRVAEDLVELKVDRRIFKSGENRMTQHEYYAMERLEPDMPDALLEFQENEDYYQTVKKDMQLLEGERASLRQEARELKRRQKNILDMAKVSVVGLCIVLGILLVATIAIGDTGTVLFTMVIFLAAVLAIGLYYMLAKARREVGVVQRKLDKATNMLNKIKIKYVNIAGTVEYQRTKYDVRNAHELNSQYNLYLEVKEERRKVAALTSQLSDVEIQLENLLKQLDLYDPHIWLAQAKALIDPKEMVEVRHELTTRRQKLRAKIKYNEDRIEEAKKNVMWIAVNNPARKQDVMRILDEYETGVM